MQRKVFAAIAVLVCLASVAQASAVLTVGTNPLLPNTKNQVVNIFMTATGGDNTRGMNFYALVADGGPGNVLTGPGSIVGPKITAMNIVGAGMLFAPPNNTGQNDPTTGFFGPQGSGASTTTPSAAIPVPAGLVLLGSITFDTTGFLSGTWDLNMGGSNNPTSSSMSDFDSTSIDGVQLGVEDGHITIVPEPSSIVMGMFALVGLSAMAVYRRRS